MTVRKYGAGVGHERLRAVQLVELDAAACEHRTYMLRDRLVLDHAGREDAREGEFGYVVLRGAEASRQDHHLRLRQSVAQRLLDAGGIVSDREPLGYRYACGVELLGYAYRVGVDDLSYEDLVTYGDYGCLYHRILLFTSIRRCFSSIGHFVFLSGTYGIFPYICAQNQYSDTNGKFQ